MIPISTPSIFVIGHRGMLGNCALRFFESKGFQTVTTSLRWESPEFKNALRSFEGEFIVNCVGSLPLGGCSDEEMIRNNFDLPVWISTNTRAKQIVPGSDAEFSGKLPIGELYRVDANSDAEDTYGIQKALLSQAANNCDNLKVIRTSIIGIESHSSKSLVNWFLSQDESNEVNGFTNVYWNGITTLEWCKCCLRIIKDWDCKNSQSLTSYRNIVQVASQPISKFELLQQIAKVFEKSTRIRPSRRNSDLNRCLHPINQTKDIVSQLVELRAFYGI